MMISMDKEGDSTILFRNSEGIPLAEITFTLCEYQGKRTMFIGGLQGAKWEIPHQEIQNATKACHGLFPKRLVMESGLSVCPTFAGRADYCPSAMKRIFTAACVIAIKKARSMPITTLSGNRLAAYVMLNAITAFQHR